MQLEAVETLLIQAPFRDAPERPIFPLTPEREKETLNIGRFHCPMCTQSCLVKNADFIREAMFEAWSPKDILVALKRKRCFPRDKDNKVITNPLDFEQVLGLHLLHCLSEDSETYRKHWTRSLENDRIQASLKSRFREMGVQDQPTTTVAGQRGLVASSNSMVVSSAANSMDVSDLSMPDMLRELIKGEMQALLLQNRAYLADLKAGKRVTPPNTSQVNSFIGQLNSLIGKFGVSDMINPDDLIA